MRYLRIYSLISWAGFVLAVLSLWLQFHAGVYRTIGWLWFPFALVSAAAAAAATVLSLYCLVRGPRRWTALGLGVAGAAPLGAWAGLVLYMFAQQRHHNLPNTAIHKVGRMAAVNLIEWHARSCYPHQLDTPRFVMHFGDGVTQPEADAAAMDAHLAKLEERLGRKQRYPIHWVRGRALGMTGMCIHSVALGGNSSPTIWFDRHEVAHAFMYQFSRPEAEPPMLLLEGFAMAVDGHEQPLATAALQRRADFDASKIAGTCLHTILEPSSYHVGTDYAYYIGGAFVDFLLRHHGGESFIEFYNSIHPETINEACRQSFGCEFGELERDFWKDMEARSKNEK